MCPWFICTVLSLSLLPVPELQGSHESQQQQNAEADREHLVRIENDKQLSRLEGDHTLVRLPQGKTILIDGRLNPKWRWCLPQTKTFLEQLSDDYFEEFHQRLQINSAVRTVTYQKRLGRHNHNAAPPTGDERSSHLTGATIDIAKKVMNEEELWWMRSRLVELQSHGVIRAVEEKEQSCFHVMVYKPDVPQSETASAVSSVP